MNNTQMLEQLRKKITEACPELLELSLGCEVESNGGYITLVCKTTNENNVQNISGRSVQHDKTLDTKKTIYSIDSCGYIRKNSIEEFERTHKQIIGHPINLEHVLITIRKLDRDAPVTISEHGDLLNTDTGEVAWWDFSSPLSQQSEEVISFIYKILL